MNHKLVSPALMWAIVLFGFAASWYYAPDGMAFDTNPVFCGIFALTIGNWLFFFVNAIRVHPQAAKSAHKINRLVTYGVYSLVRHPLYSADVALAWGAFFFFPYWKMLFAVLWMTFVLVIWMFLEEAALVEKFGQQYIAYRKNVPMLIPKNYRSKKR